MQTEWPVFLFSILGMGAEPFQLRKLARKGVNSRNWENLKHTKSTSNTKEMNFIALYYVKKTVWPCSLSFHQKMIKNFHIYIEFIT